MGLKRWMNAQSFAVLRDGCNEVSQRNLHVWRLASASSDGANGTHVTNVTVFGRDALLRVRGRVTDIQTALSAFPAPHK